MTTNRRRPVPRWKVAAGALALLAALAAIMLLADTLRYPNVDLGHGEEEPALASDPRDPVECAAPQPREGQPRVSPGDDLKVIERVSSANLYDCPQSYDGVQVRFRGEVVGAVLRRDDGAWVHLNDDVYANVAGPLPGHRFYRGGNAGVGVFLPHELANDIVVVGGPRTKGDVVEVVGVFHRIDPITRDVAVIRAAAGTNTPGGPFPRPDLPIRRYLAIGLALLTALVVVAERRLTRERRDAGLG